MDAAGDAESDTELLFKKELFLREPVKDDDCCNLENIFCADTGDMEREDINCGGAVCGDTGDELVVVGVVGEEESEKCGLDNWRSRSNQEFSSLSLAAHNK